MILKNDTKLSTQKFLEGIIMTTGKIIKEIWTKSAPLIYLFFWYFLPINLFGDKLNENHINTLIITSLPVIFIGILANKNSWSIGGKNGINADSSRDKIEFCFDKIGTFKLYGNTSEVRKDFLYRIKHLIQELLRNKRGV
jgi:hypothetical protein